MRGNKNIMFIFLVCILILTAVIGWITLNYISRSSKDNTKVYAVINSNGLKNTIISPHMEAPIDGNNNVVYCSTFQLAWNELRNNIIKEYIKLNKNLKDVEILNKGIGTKQDISEKDYIAIAGYKKDDILGKINKSLKNKFGDSAPKVEEKLDDPNDILAYAYLNKNLKFQYQFEALKKGISFNANGNTADIKCFGIEKFKDDAHYEKLGSQVDILDYRDDSNFIINLKAKDSEDDIILANIEPKDTLLETINEVNSRIKPENKELLKSNDTLQIPILNLNVNKDYTEFENIALMNKGFQDYIIAKAVQCIQFNLDKDGAQLKSEAKIVLTKSVPAPNSKVKKLIFNKPFLIMLKEKGRQYPYFAMWVENKDVMED